MVFAPRLFATALVAAVAVPSFAPAAEGRRIALLVGVSDYQASAELRTLPGAANDVARLRDVLLTGGYRPDDIVLLSSGAGGSKPTADAIRGALKNTLSRCTEDDTVLVAFAGHGLQFGGSEERFFCPYDAVWNQHDTLVPLSQVFERLAKCPAKRKLLLVDACRNDPLADSGNREKLQKSLAKGFSPAVPEGSDFAALFSCAEGETSWEDRRLNHGVFFYHVIRGLAGDAAGKNGAVTLDSLVAYTRSSVTEYVKENFEAKQVPLLRLAGEAANFPIVQQEGVSKAQQRIREGILAVANGDSKAALAAYADAITLDKKNAEAYFQRGLLLAKSGKFDDAVLDFTRALRYKPDHVSAYFRRADAYYNLDDKKRSLEDYALALDEDPENVDVLNDRGFVYFELKEYAKALKDFDRAISIEPGCAKSYYYRSLVRAAMKEPEAAMKDLDKAIAIDPHHPRFAEARLTAAIEAKDDTRVAEEEARQERVVTYIARNDFKSQEAFNNQSYYVGNYYRDTGRNERADKAFDRTARQAEGLFDRASKLNPSSISNKRIADQAAREVERMPVLKQRAIEGRLAQYENALGSGDRARADRLAKDIEGKLPPALRKEFQQARNEDRNERGGGGIFGNGGRNGGNNNNGRNGNGNGNNGGGIFGGGRNPDGNGNGNGGGIFGGGRNPGGNNGGNNGGNGGGIFGGGRPPRGGR